jgi:hypothetical protein
VTQSSWTTPSGRLRGAWRPLKPPASSAGSNDRIPATARSRLVSCRSMSLDMATSSPRTCATAQIFDSSRYERPTRYSSPRALRHVVAMVTLISASSLPPVRARPRWPVSTVDEVERIMRRNSGLDTTAKSAVGLTSRSRTTISPQALRSRLVCTDPNTEELIIRFANLRRCLVIEKRQKSESMPARDARYSVKQRAREHDSSARRRFETSWSVLREADFAAIEIIIKND